MKNLYLNALNTLALQRDVIIFNSKHEKDPGLRIRLTMERTVIEFKIKRIMKRINA